jgi:hypothetical protein
MSSYRGGWVQPGPPAGNWLRYGPRPVMPPGPRRSRRGLVFGLGASMVALVVAIVVIAADLIAANSDQSKLHQAWAVSTPDERDDAITDVAYPTVDRRTFVRVSRNAVVGYAIATGRTRWTVRMPQYNKVCAATHGAPDGVVAILSGVDGDCTTVVAVDVRSGRRLWSAVPHRDTLRHPPSSGALFAAAGRIYVTDTERMVSYDAKAGPAGTGAAKPVETHPRSTYCRFDGVSATADLLVTIQVCADDSQTLVGLDPRTMRPRLHTLLHTGLDTVDIVSVRPLVLHVLTGLHSDGELLLFDETGKQARVISSNQPKGELGLELYHTSSIEFDDDNADSPVTIVGTTLVAQVYPKNDDGERKLAGIDLRTGSWKWTAPLDTKHRIRMAVSDDPHKVAVLAQGSPMHTPFKSFERPHLLHIDPANGEVTKGHSLDVDDDPPELDSASTFEVGDRVIVVRSEAFLAPIVAGFDR